MSLNGLEATEINDAYQAALGEGGGWFVFLKRPQEKEKKRKEKVSKADDFFCRFLLHYVSRDEVGLLEKGNGGLADLQEVVNRYEKQSPLYGFIQYRRRKVLLKYTPEGTSRLLQGERLLSYPLSLFSNTMLRWRQLVQPFNFPRSPRSSPPMIQFSLSPNQRI